MFIKYQHIERFGTPEVEGIELGTCYVFPKLDGTNASVWMDDNGNICAGSRNRQLTLDQDNAGFYAHVIEDEKYRKYFYWNPKNILYGEWLVPHSLKTYQDHAWRRFYVFDVLEEISEVNHKYVPYPDYATHVAACDIDYIPALAICKNPSPEQLYGILEKNQYLIQDGKGAGEGIVIKNYDFVNKYGRMTWAKIVRSEFKDLNSKKMGASVIKGETIVEDRIVEKYCTEALVEKEYEKIALDGWTAKSTPRLFETVFYSIVNEESWNIVKEFNKPKIDYKLLYAKVIQKIKQVKRELF